MLKWWENPIVFFKKIHHRTDFNKNCFNFQESLKVEWIYICMFKNGVEIDIREWAHRVLKINISIICALRLFWKLIKQSYTTYIFVITIVMD